jgi:PAS domain-containing protein
VHGGHRFLRWSLWAHPAEKLIYATASDIEDLHREAFEGRLLGQASHIGIWELEPETNMIHWSSEAHALHGNPPGSPPISLDDALRSYPADSRERLRAALADLRENGIGFDIDAPFHVPLGTSRQVRIRGARTSPMAGSRASLAPSRTSPPQSRTRRGAAGTNVAFGR